MDNNILKIMADTVARTGTCVMEVIIGEEGALAHLIPADIWLQDDEEESDEE